jgi:hypothetical protein
MKSAFAKLMQKDPVESSHIAFRAGGNGVPILTRASGSSTAGFQNTGNSYSCTTLGAYRMGDQDGNAPGSAIYPNDIFGPHGQPDREYPERTFANVGNNVFQPQTDDSATIALLRRLGDQQFKATSQEPFENYRAQQRLARDLDEASRNASISDVGLTREIIRNLAAERRQQNEDDYLRKMLDAGATPEAARKEIEDVRNANAIQEAKKVDDREYQAKTLISRIAMARGVTPMVREPLNQSSSIDNPQRSQAMSQAMGMPGEGFGTSPLDANRQFMTPEFYKKYLRRSTVTQESADEQGAFNRLLSEGDIPIPPQGAYSMATLKGQERQAQVEMASEGLASRLESIRARGNRILQPLPDNILFKKILDRVYSSKKKVKGDKVLYSLETIQDMNLIQLLLAINTAVISGGVRAFNRLQQGVRSMNLGTMENVPDDLGNKIRILALRANGDESNISIPFASARLSSNRTELLTELYDTIDQIKTGRVGDISGDIQRARTELASQSDLPEPLRSPRNTTRRNRGGAVLPGGATAEMAQAEVPGAPNVGGGGGGR